MISVLIVGVLFQYGKNPRPIAHKCDMLKTRIFEAFDLA